MATPTFNLTPNPELTDLTNPDLVAILNSNIAGNFNADSHLFDKVHDFLLMDVPMHQKIQATEFLSVEVMGVDDEIGPDYVNSYIQEIKEYRNTGYTQIPDMDDSDLDTLEDITGVSLGHSTMAELYATCDNPNEQTLFDAAAKESDELCPATGAYCQGCMECEDDPGDQKIEYPLDKFPLDKLIETPGGYLCPECRKNDQEQLCYWDECFCPSCGADNVDFLMSHNEGGF